MMCVQTSLYCKLIKLAFKYYHIGVVKAMAWNGLERNKLDYVLTDLLPVELPESFSFRSLYNFLMKKENQNKINKVIYELKKNQVQGLKVFNNKWATMPFKYNILKGYDAFREMSIIQPFSAINIFLFIELYQKDILYYFSKYHFFSLRYHTKNTDLFYKLRSKQITHYFSKQVKQVNKRAIQQVGNFYTIKSFESINAFTESRIWRMCNFKFRYYARIDYQSCFDSIYSHVFKWIIERTTTDSKDADNSNLFITIDRILQNINGLSSNGLIVGPEFSRMISEILLQHIDNKVLTSLKKLGVILNKDYMVFRYVDDIFIFSTSQENIELIINKYKKISKMYLLRISEQKLVKGETPCLPKGWYEKTLHLVDLLRNLFYEETVYKKLPEEEKFIVKASSIAIDRIKNEITIIIKEYSNDRRTVVSYLLSVLYNNINKKKDGYKLFKNENYNKAYLLIDLSFFIYSFCPSFEQTRKLISIISYINDEINFKEKDSKENKRLQSILRRYSFIFINKNLSDLCDWFLFFNDFNISLNIETETKIVEILKNDNNPVILANLLIYSKYNELFFNEMKTITYSIINENLERISKKKPMLQSEFWYVLIFHNCPYITSQLSNKIEDIIMSIKPTSHKIPSDIVLDMVCDFLQQKSLNGEKPKDSLINWNINNVSEQITFRTFQKTIFKNYRGNKYRLYASLD
jgi:hypothetical protein